MASISSPSGARQRAQLDQRAGQVVDPVQDHRTEHEVEAIGGERQRLARRRPPCGPRPASIAAARRRPPAAPCRSGRAVPARPGPVGAPRTSTRRKSRRMSPSRSSSRSITSSTRKPAGSELARRDGRAGAGPSRRSKTRIGSLTDPPSAARWSSRTDALRGRVRPAARRDAGWPWRDARASRAARTCRARPRSRLHRR